MLIYFFLQKILCKRMRREEGKSLKNCVSRELSGNSRRFFVSSFAYTFFMSCSKCKLMWMGPPLILFTFPSGGGKKREKEYSHVYFILRVVAAYFGIKSAVWSVVILSE